LYKALYRKWRPLTFDDVISQQHITETLKNQIKSGKTAHAYLFTGSRGTGKTTCARILAKAVNCQNLNDGNPCLECEICVDAEKSALSDIIEIDAASNNGVDDIRDLREGTVYTPERCNYKVYIIDEVHMLSPSAFNALLKIMEEPPAYVKFILATTEIHKVPATITSRCQRYDFRRIKSADIAQRLKYIAEQENINLSDDGAQLIGKLADGGMRDAISLLDQCSVCAEQITAAEVSNIAGIAGRDYLYKLLDAVADEDTAQALTVVSSLYDMSKDLTRLCEELITQLRNIMLIRLTPETAAELIVCMPEELAELRRISEKMPLETVMEKISALQECRERMNRVLNKRVEFEMGIIRICRNIQQNNPVSIDNSEIYDKIKQLEEKLRSGNFKVQKPEESAVQQASSPAADVEPKPDVDLRTVKPEDIIPFDRWNDVLLELEKINPAVNGSLAGSRAGTVGNVLLVIAENRFFMTLFKNKDNALSLNEAIFRVTGKRYAIRAKCSVTKQQQQSMAEALIKKAQSSGIDTAVE
jgi:DNA polymerase-3 subunit gamma/tau